MYLIIVIEDHSFSTFIKLSEKLTNNSYTLISTRAYVYQVVRNVSFPENFENVPNE